MISKVRHGNKHNVEVERKHCDFSPQKLYNYVLFSTFKSVPEKLEKMGLKKRSRVPKTCVVPLLHMQ